MSEMITVNIDFPKLAAALKRLAASGRNLAPVMRVAAGIIGDAVEENFEQEGRPRWKSLAASTLRQRAKEGSTGKILQRSGDLAKSISRHSDATSAIVGTNSKYAGTQQFGAKKGAYGATKHGSPIPWGDIPARPFLMLGKDDEADIVQSFARFLGKAVG